MDSRALQENGIGYTLSKIKWRRWLSDLSKKRQRAEQNEKQRMQVQIMDKVANPTLGFEVEHFKLFGALKKAETEVRNTMPTSKTVVAETDYNIFNDFRKKQPHAVQYDRFYGFMQTQAKTPRIPKISTSLSYSVVRKSLRTDQQIYMKICRHA